MEEMRERHTERAIPTVPQSPGLGVSGRAVPGWSLMILRSTAVPPLETGRHAPRRAVMVSNIVTGTPLSARLSEKLKSASMFDKHKLS